MLLNLKGDETLVDYQDYNPETHTEVDRVLVAQHDIAHALNHAGTKHIGLSVKGDTNPLEIKGYLDSVELIQINFPAFTDGRGFSLAAKVRQWGFKGEIRANGPLMPDQGWHLVRSGFDSLNLEKEERAEAFKQSVKAFEFSYQRTYHDREMVAEKRH